MGIESTIPVLWSGELQQRLHKALVYGAIANRKYENEFAFGDRITIPMINTLATATYTPNSGSAISYQQVDAAPVYLDIDQRYIAAFTLEDLDKRQAKGDIMGEATREMAYVLADQVDQSIAGMYGQAQIHVATSATSTNSTVIAEYLTLANSKMDEGNVPREGRWMVCRPWFLQKMILADITLNTNNTSTLANGFTASRYGFNVYVSNNAFETTPATHTNSRVLFGYADTIALVTQLSNVEVLRDKDTVADYVRALLVWGKKVVRPDTLAVFPATYAAEP